MARDRQRAKQRQAERRARRLAAEGRESGPDAEAAAEPKPDGAGSADLAAVPPTIDGEPEPHLAAGAPPEQLGRSDAALEDEAVLEEELEDYDVEDEQQPVDEGEAYAPRGRRGTGEAEAGGGPAVVQFLRNCWAELKRVQWPNRQQLITLTWVVLGFVLIAGGYLGLLDAIFNQLVKAIL